LTTKRGHAGHLVLLLLLMAWWNFQPSIIFWSSGLLFYILEALKIAISFWAPRAARAKLTRKLEKSKKRFRKMLHDATIPLQDAI
jgi:hypothetical protein